MSILFAFCIVMIVAKLLGATTLSWLIILTPSLVFIAICLVIGTVAHLLSKH